MDFRWYITLIIESIVARIFIVDLIILLDFLFELLDMIMQISDFQYQT